MPIVGENDSFSYIDIQKIHCNDELAKRVPCDDQSIEVCEDQCEDEQDANILPIYSQKKFLYLNNTLVWLFVS